MHSEKVVNIVVGGPEIGQESTINKKSIGESGLPHLDSQFPSCRGWEKEARIHTQKHLKKRGLSLLNL